MFHIHVKMATHHSIVLPHPAKQSRRYMNTRCMQNTKSIALLKWHKSSIGLELIKGGGGGVNLTYSLRVIARDTILWLAFLACHKLLVWWEL